MYNQKLPSGTGGSTLVVGPARCGLRELERCNGLPGRDGVFATRVDSEVNISAVLGLGIAGKLKSSATSLLLATALNCLCAKDLAAAMLGLALLPELRGLGLLPSALASLPLLSLDGANLLEGVSGGEDLSLPLPLPAMSCFRFSALPKLPSVIRLGSSRGLQGHLPAAGSMDLFSTELMA